MKGAAFALTVMLAVHLAACGERDQADDQALHQGIVNGASGSEVTFDATVLGEPVQSGNHERFEVKDTTGENLEIDHNTDLAPSVPTHVGDHLVIHGQLYMIRGPTSGFTARMPPPPAAARCQAGSSSRGTTTSSHS